MTINALALIASCVYACLRGIALAAAEVDAHNANSYIYLLLW